MCLSAESELDLTLIWGVGSSSAGRLGVGPQCTLNFWGPLKQAEAEMGLQGMAPPSKLPGSGGVGRGMEVLLVPSFLPTSHQICLFSKEATSVNEATGVYSWSKKLRTLLTS